MNEYQGDRLILIFKDIADELGNIGRELRLAREAAEWRRRQRLEKRVAPPKSSGVQGDVDA